MKCAAIQLSERISFSLGALWVELRRLAILGVVLPGLWDVSVGRIFVSRIWLVGRVSSICISNLTPSLMTGAPVEELY